MSRTISSQVGIVALGRFLSYLVMFFVPLVNVRTLTVHDFGLYRQYWLIFETIAGLLEMAFPNSLVYFLPRADKAKTKAVYVTQTIAFLFGMGLVSWGVYGLLDAVLGEGLGGVIDRFFWPLCLFTLFMLVSQTLDRLFIAEGQVERQAVYQSVTSLVLAATIIIISWRTGRVDLIVTGLVFFAFLRFLFTVGYAIQVYRPPLRELSRRTFLDQFSYSLPLGLAGSVFMLLALTDKYIVTHFLGREVFAIYSVGAFQLPLADIIGSSVSFVTFTHMTKYEKAGELGRIVDLWRRAALKTSVLFFPVFLFLEVSARPFITIVFTQQYAAAVPVFMIYLLLLVRSTVEPGSLLTLFRRNALRFKLTVAALICNVVLSIFFLKKFGWLGVAAATVIVNYLQNFAYLVIGGRLLETPLSAVLPWRGLAVRLLAAMVPTAALFVSYRLVVVDTFIELAAAGAAFFALHFAICFGFRLLTVDDVRRLFRRDLG